MNLAGWSWEKPVIFFDDGIICCRLSSVNVWNDCCYFIGSFFSWFLFILDIWGLNMSFKSLPCLRLPLWYWTDFATPVLSRVSWLRWVFVLLIFARSSYCLCSLLRAWKEGAGNWFYDSENSLSWTQLKIRYCQEICHFQEDWLTVGSPNFLD